MGNILFSFFIIIILHMQTTYHFPSAFHSRISFDFVFHSFFLFLSPVRQQLQHLFVHILFALVSQSVNACLLHIQWGYNK